MDQLKAIAGWISAALVVAVLSGCTATTAAHPANESHPSSAHTPAGTARGTTGSVSEIATPQSEDVVKLSPDYPADATVLGELSSKRGAAAIGPITVKSPRIAVYVRCYGSTSVHVTIEGVAKFDQQCASDAGDRGTMNTFDVRYVSTFTVQVTSDNQNMWALAVTDF
ncbi:MAG: hypothetical protein FWF75_02085 [Propionibacteriaceae bacterium]|nr:hypothetical protein [Propionibacteriaceae bacterium]